MSPLGHPVSCIFIIFKKKNLLSKLENVKQDKRGGGGEETDDLRCISCEKGHIYNPWPGKSKGNQKSYRVCHRFRLTKHDDYF